MFLRKISRALAIADHERLVKIIVILAGAYDIENVKLKMVDDRFYHPRLMRTNSITLLGIEL